MSDLKDKFAPWVGIVAVASFGAALVFLFRHVGDVEPQWSRLVYVFGGVEAAGLAALGFFFGREVNRARAENAENRADNAEQAKVAANAQRVAAETTLNALNAVIEQKLANLGNTGGRGRDLLAGFDRKIEVAEQFPDLLEFLRQPQQGDRSNGDW